MLISTSQTARIPIEEHSFACKVTDAIDNILLAATPYTASVILDGVTFRSGIEMALCSSQI